MKLAASPLPEGLVGRSPSERKPSAWKSSMAKPRETPSKALRPYNDYRVQDARFLSESLAKSDLVDATVTSPPYWDVKNYGGRNEIGFRQSLEAYLDDLTSVFSQVWKHTKDSGTLWIVVKSVKKNGILYLLPFQLAERLTSIGKWYLQDILIWHKPHTLPWSHKGKLPDHYEHILCLSKAKSLSLNISDLRSPQNMTKWWVKYPERYHPFGKSLSNVWEMAIPTQGSWGNGDVAHHCPLPVELVKRILLLSTKKGDLVFDPFAGTGTTALAAAELNRRWIMLDINPKYRSMFQRRWKNEQVTSGGSSNGRSGSLARINLRLRQLKYAVVLYKRMSPSLRLTVTDVPIVVVEEGQYQTTPSPHWVTGCRIRLILSNECFKRRKRAIEEAIAELATQPPLSKYQIDALVDVMPFSRFRRTLADAPCKWVAYTCGYFWKYSRDIDLDHKYALVNKSLHPLVISNIVCNEKSAY